MSEQIREISLAGEWSFARDDECRGVTDAWWKRSLDECVCLPGCLTEQGIGDPITVDTPWQAVLLDRSYYEKERFAPYRQEGNVKVPFFLQPDLYYAGAAWYQKQVEIPSEWVGKKVELFLERPHWRTSVWLDDEALGSRDSLSVPHVYDLGTVEVAGAKTLSLCVDNSEILNVGRNAHSVSDNTQGNWNGVIGAIALRVKESVELQEVQLFPDAEKREIEFSGAVRGWNQADGVLEARFEIRSIGGSAEITLVESTIGLARLDGEGRFSGVLPFEGKPSLWSEFSPSLYELVMCIGEVRTIVRFGFRTIERIGRQLLLNGSPLFLRGTLDCAAFPKSGYPPMDKGEWRRVFGVIQAHGLNHVRFHSWCPPRVAFELADELGLYLQIEAATWPNDGCTLGEGNPLDTWSEAESLRILREYGNHPSFLFMALGNEPSGEGHEEWLQDWLRRRKAEDCRRLYCGTAGWPELSENEFHIADDPRIQHWEEGLGSRVNRLPPETVTDYRDFIDAQSAPVVSHEIGQWCVYPNFKEMEKYTGYLKPRNFEIFEEWLKAKGMGDLADDFVFASGKLQALLYKEEIEAALRTPSMGGFQLLGLQDFPGQGSAFVGLVDAFWEAKPYLTASAFSRFCGPIVPLARFHKRVYQSSDTLSVELELAQFGELPLYDREIFWKLVSKDGRSVSNGSLPPRDLEPTGLLALGRVEIGLSEVACPAAYRFVLSIGGSEIENDWDVWVYPDSVARHDSHGGVRITRSLNEATRAALEAGGTVFCQLPASEVCGDENGRVQLGFSTTFWNTSWTNGQAPHTMGILCDPKHEAFKGFPTESHSNWQWWYVLKRAEAMVLDGLPARVEPIVRIVDDWFHVRRLALVVELKVGQGRLLLSSIDFEGSEDPVTRQLLSSLLVYMTKEPRGELVEVSWDELLTLSK